MNQLYEVVIIGKNIKTASEATLVSDFVDDWWGALRRADELSYQLKGKMAVRCRGKLLQGFNDGNPYQLDPTLNIDKPDDFKAVGFYCEWPCHEELPV